jgi:hypothetical protein
MKNKKMKKGIAGIHEIRMSKNESLVIFENLVKHINQTPVVKELKPAQSNFYSFYFFKSLYSKPHFAYASFSFLGVFFVGVGAIFAATSSIPGDILYPIKIKIVEPVEKILAITPMAKVNLSALKTEENLQEATQLINNNTLNEENRTLLEQDFKKHRSDFNNSTQNSGTSSLEVISKTKIHLENTIQEYSKVLNKIEENDKSGQKKEIEKFKNILHDTFQENNSVEKSTSKNDNQHIVEQRKQENPVSYNENKVNEQVIIMNSILYNKKSSTSTSSLLATSSSVNNDSKKRKEYDTQKEKTFIISTYQTSSMSASTTIETSGNTSSSTQKASKQEKNNDTIKNISNASNSNSTTTQEIIKDIATSTTKSNDKETRKIENVTDRKND